jgi:hypothetical protein
MGVGVMEERGGSEQWSEYCDVGADVGGECEAEGNKAKNFAACFFCSEIETSREESE